MSAPAGYGKSTLVAAWLGDTRQPHAWLSLDRSHCDPRVLIRDLTGAVEMAFPEQLATFTRRLVGAAAETEPESLLRGLVAAIERITQEQFVFVLDDVHVLKGSDSVETFEHFLRQPPSNIELVLLTRAWDVIPELARRVADGAASVLLERDLAFDDAEAARLLRRTGLRDRTTIDALTRRADGWPAALALLGEHHTRGPNSGPNTTAAFVLSDFLDREVLARLSRPQLALLETCGVLETFESDVLYELAPTGRLAEGLRRLELHTQLITRAGQGMTYRVHGLLAEQLVERLRRRAPDRLHELRLAACEAFARRGQAGRAIEFAFDAEDWVQAADRIAEVHEQLYQRGEWSTLARWIDRLPTSVLNSRPHLLLTRASVDNWSRHPEAGLLRLNRIDPASLDSDQRALRAAYKVSALRWLGRSAEAIQVARTARTAHGSCPDPAGHASALLYLEEGITLGASGELERALVQLEHAREGFEQLGDPRHTAAVHKAVGATYFYLGRLREAVRAFDQTVHLAETLGDVDYHCMALNNLSNVHQGMGELGTARSILETVIQRADVHLLERSAAYARESLAEVEHDLGHLDRTNVLLDEASKRWPPRRDHNLHIYIRRVRTLLHLERGRHAEAERLCLEARATLTERQWEFHASWFDSLLGAVRIAQGRPADALPLLDRALRVARRRGAVVERGRAQFRRAHALLLLGQVARCHRALADVAAIASQIGYDEFLWVDARLAPTLIEYAVARNRGHVFAGLAARRDGGERLPERAPDFIAGALGPFSLVRVADRSRVQFRSERSIEMLFFLLEHGSPARKEEIAAALWPEIDPDRLNSPFHSTLYRLREAIGRDRVVRRGDRYGLADGAAFRYDAREFDDLIARTRSLAAGDPERCRLLADARALYGGPFADGCDSEWVEPRRRALARDYHALLSEAGRAAESDE